jgi:hypothetical protein
MSLSASSLLRMRRFMTSFCLNLDLNNIITVAVSAPYISTLYLSDTLSAICNTFSSFLLDQYSLVFAEVMIYSFCLLFVISIMFVSITNERVKRLGGSGGGEGGNYISEAPLELLSSSYMFYSCVIDIYQCKIYNNILKI